MSKRCVVLIIKRMTCIVGTRLGAALWKVLACVWLREKVEKREISVCARPIERC